MSCSTTVTSIVVSTVESFFVALTGKTQCPGALPIRRTLSGSADAPANALQGVSSTENAPSAVAVMAASSPTRSRTDCCFNQIEGPVFELVVVQPATPTTTETTTAGTVAT